MLSILALSPAAAQSASRVSADFNGDGAADLAVGVPYEDGGVVTNAGAVNVIYGTPGGGLSSAGNQIWHQNSPGIADTAEAGDRFGFSLIAGDFDGDGADDLAVGVPGEDVGGVIDAGAVNVIYGVANLSLTSAGDQLWHQNTPGIADSAELGDYFGRALGAGDFDGDGADDLAVGAPFEDGGAVTDAGAVNLIYGTAGGGAGLSSAGNQIWHQNSPGIADSAEDEDQLGRSLSAGDFDADGADDLAIGVPFEDVGALADAGAVNVIYGTAGGGAGLSPAGNQLWNQDSPGIADSAETFDVFGFSLAAGDFDNDGADDLAVGVPAESVVPEQGGGTVFIAGAVNVIHGTAGGGAGLSPAGNQLWHQDSPGIVDSAEFDDVFGRALSAGDFNGDFADDLAVGAVSEDLGAAFDAGAVNVIYGTAGGGAGLSPAGNQLWHQDSPGILDAVEGFDHFGDAVSAGDFDEDGDGDLAIGVSDEDVGALNNAGAVNVIYGTALGLSSVGNQLWHQDSPGIADSAEVFDEFGSNLPGSAPALSL